MQATKHGGTVTVKMDRFSWTSSSNLCVLPGESGVHQQSGIRIYDGDKKAGMSLFVVGGNSYSKK